MLSFYLISKAWWGYEGSWGFKRHTYIWYMGFSWCCGLCRTTALFKPFEMQTVIICASVHPQPVSALWRHPVLSPSSQRLPLFHMQLVFSLYSLPLFLSFSLSLCQCVMPDWVEGGGGSSASTTNQVTFWKQISIFSSIFKKNFSLWPTGPAEFWIFLSCERIWRCCVRPCLSENRL